MTMTPLEQARERHVDGLQLRTEQWKEIVRDAFNAGAVAAMLTKRPERTLRQRISDGSRPFPSISQQPRKGTP